MKATRNAVSNLFGSWVIETCKQLNMRKTKVTFLLLGIQVCWQMLRLKNKGNECHFCVMCTDKILKNSSFVLNAMFTCAFMGRVGSQCWDEYHPLKTIEIK